MKRFNYTKSILTLFALATVIFGGSVVVANAQAQFRRALDFDGDNKADVTVVRHGQWYTLNSSNNSPSSLAWGGENLEQAMTGDYDGDGKADTTIVRTNLSAQNLTWYIRRSQTNTLYAVNFGAFVNGTLDTPIPADYDGDGKTDIAVVRRTSANPNTLTWFYLSSQTGQVRGSGTIQITSPGAGQTCNATNGDFNGDTRADYVYVCRDLNNPNAPLTWNITLTSSGVRYQTQWGLTNDQTAAGDYDGDGKTDFGAARLVPIPNSPTNDKYLVWYIFLSQSQTVQAKYFGGSFNNDTFYDAVTPADYDGDGKTDIAVCRFQGGGIQSAVNYYIQQSLTNQLRSVTWGFSDDSIMTMGGGANPASLNAAS